MQKLTIGTHNTLNREKWLKQTLKKIPKGVRILDAGAGELQYKKYCTHLDYVSQDFGQYDGKGDEKGLHMNKWDNSKLDIVSDITDIPEKDESFDVIMCIEVFEHLPDPISAIKEFSRLLKKGGKLIVTAPFCSLTHFSPYHYYSGFNKNFYKKHYNSSKLDIIEIDRNGDFFEFIAQEIRRLPSIADEYSNLKEMGRIKRYFFDKYYQFLSKSFFRILNKFHNTGKESDELLCFGYHVLAEKK